jgi:hypothetical protein
MIYKTYAFTLVLRSYNYSLYCNSDVICRERLSCHVLINLVIFKPRPFGGCQMQLEFHRRDLKD